MNNNNNNNNNNKNNNNRSINNNTHVNRSKKAKIVTINFNKSTSLHNQQHKIKKAEKKIS